MFRKNVPPPSLGSKISQARNHHVASGQAISWFLVQLIFNPEDGGDLFLQNIGSHMNHVALYPRRWQHSYLLQWECQTLNRIHVWFGIFRIHLAVTLSAWKYYRLVSLLCVFWQSRSCREMWLSRIGISVLWVTLYVTMGQIVYCVSRLAVQYSSHTTVCYL
jgi:hypothetical protein